MRVNRVLVLVQLLVLACSAYWSTGSEVVDLSGSQPLSRELDTRKRGSCTNRKRCMRKCPGGLKPDFIWYCLKPQHCVKRTKGKCFYNTKFVCRRRLEETNPVMPLRRRTSCPIYEGIFDFGLTCLGTTWTGFCRVGGSTGNYYTINKVSYDECKARCYSDLNCEAIEYQFDTQKCEIHMERPTKTASSSTTRCVLKNEDNYDCEAWSFEKVTDGWCRDYGNSQGLYILFPRITSKGACLSLCQGHPGCVGFEWQPGRKKCEIHFRSISRWNTKPVSSSARPECYIKT